MFLEHLQGHTDSTTGRVRATYRVLVPISRESPTAITLLSFLVEAVWSCGVGHLTLDNLKGGSATTSSLTSSSSSRTHKFLLHRGTWGIVVCQDGGCLWHQAETCFHFSSFKSPPSAQQWQGRESTTVWISITLVSVLQFNRELLQQAISHSTSCSHSLTLLNLSTSLSFTTILGRSPTYSHLTQVKCLLPFASSHGLRHVLQLEPNVM